MHSPGKEVLVVVGDRTANEVRESAEASGKFAEVVPYYYDVKTLGGFAESLRGATVSFNIAIANPDVKRAVSPALNDLGWHPATIIDPRAVVSPSASIGAGCFVAPLAVVSSNARVMDGAIVHFHASVGHDCHIGENVAVLPGARISGNVRVGDGTIVGSNAFIAAGVAVGGDCRIDALAYVATDLADNYLASPRIDEPIRRVV